jgi:flagellar protein FlaG
MDVSSVSVSTAVSAAANQTKPQVKSSPPIQRADSADVQRALNEINQGIGSTKNELNFSIDEDTGVSVVKVIDPETKDVIAQYPGEEVIRIAQFLGKVKGLFVAQTA